jgi:hypothetical protein
MIARIKNGDIDTLKLALNAATKLQTVEDNDTTLWGNSAGYGVLWSTNFTLAVATDVWLDIQLNHSPTSNINGSYRCFLNGVQEREQLVREGGVVRFVLPKRTLGVGTHTIEIEVGGFGFPGSYRTNPQTLGVFEAIR